MKLRLATRRSRLALSQTRAVAQSLRTHEPSLQIEEIAIETLGDKVLDRPLAELGGKGLFVAEVRAAVLDGRADAAVHSLKDLPGDEPLPEGLALVAFPPRAPAHDVLLSVQGHDLDGLPQRALVGTTSLRRVCQLQHQRPDLRFCTLRGNVETRLQKLQQQPLDAIVLAAAGLERLGLTAAMLAPVRAWSLPIDVCLPAVGQGALAIEVRVDAAPWMALLALLDDAPTRRVITAERALLQRLQGNCHTPIAGYAQWTDGAQRLQLQGMVGSPDGSQLLNAFADEYVEGSTPEAWLASSAQLGQQVAEALLKQGAQRLLMQVTNDAVRHQHIGNGSGGKLPFAR